MPTRRCATVQAALVREVEAAGELFALAQATQACEEAADALMRAAHLLHRQVLGERCAFRAAARAAGATVAQGCADAR